MSTRFTELVEQLTPANVDRAAGVIRGVKILGRQSRNGRRYSDQALATALSLYEGAKVNLNHAPAADAPPGRRRFEEVFGEIRRVERRDEAICGELHFLTCHPLAATICEAAERFPHQFGLSHHAAGPTHRADDGTWIVDDLTQVYSVDIVAAPATSQGLFESELEPPEATALQALEEQIGLLSRRLLACQLLQEFRIPPAANLIESLMRFTEESAMRDELRRLAPPSETVAPRPSVDSAIGRSQSYEELLRRGGGLLASAIRRG